MADQEARDELRRLLDAAVGRLLMEGRSWEQVVEVVGRRLGGVEPAPAYEPPAGPYAAGPLAVAAYDRLRQAGWAERNDDPRRLPTSAGFVAEDRAGVLAALKAAEDDRRAAVADMVQLATDVGVPAADPDRVGINAYTTLADPVAAAAAAAAGPLYVPASVDEVRLPEDADRYPRAQVAAEPRPDEPGEPPVGSVVTDTRGRVCSRDADGWHRAGTADVLTWTDVGQAVGPDPTNPKRQIPMPGEPTVVYQAPVRAQVPMVTRSAGRLELPMQVPMTGPDGQPLLDAEGRVRTGPNGQPLLTTVTETVEMFEVVPEGQP